MRAVVFQRPNEFAVESVPEPRASPGHALVRVRASMVCATDQKILAGKFPFTRYPHVPGHEFSGEVAASDDPAWPAGTRVGVEVHVGCGTCARCREGMYTLCLNYGRRETGHAHVGFTIAGGLAEYAAVPVAALHALPETVSFEEGAWTDNLGVALYALERGRLAAGERVAVDGPGAGPGGRVLPQLAHRTRPRRLRRSRARPGAAVQRLRRSRHVLPVQGSRSEGDDASAIGLCAAQLARALGAGCVLVVGRGPRLVRARAFADEVVDASDAARLSGSADLVVEFAGTAAAARAAIAIARRGGRVVLGGATGPGVELSGVDLSTIVRGNLDLLGSLANPRGVSGRALALLARGKVDVGALVTQRFPLEEFAEAWRTFTERRDGAIRVMLAP